MNRILRISFVLTAVAALGMFFASCGGGGTTLTTSGSDHDGEKKFHPVVTLDCPTTGIAGEPITFTVTTDVPDAAGGVSHFRAGTDPDNLPDVLSGSPSGFTGDYTFSEAGTYYVQGNFAPQQPNGDWTGGESAVATIVIEEACDPTSVSLTVAGTSIPVGNPAISVLCPGTRQQSSVTGTLQIHCNGGGTFTISGHVRAGNGTSWIFSPNNQTGPGNGGNFTNWSKTFTTDCDDATMTFTINKAGGFNGGEICNSFVVTGPNGLNLAFEQASIAP